MFPVEILEILFKYSDGADIINYRLVCKTWNSVISRLSKDTNFWQIKCQNEIPNNCQRPMADKLYPKMKSFDFVKSKNNLKWLTLHKSWIKLRRINEFDILIEQFEPFFMRIPSVAVTSIAVAENLLAVGSSEGFIAFYNIDSSIVEPIFIGDQMNSVSDIQFLKHEKRIAVLTLSDMNRIMLWDVGLKKVIGNKQYGRLISTTNECIWIAMSSCLVVQYKKRKRCFDFPVLHGDIVALATDGVQGFLLTRTGYNYTINLSDPKSECIESYMKPPAGRVKKYYLFWPLIGICITENGFLGTSVNRSGWVIHEILSKLHGTPTAVLFYANILVLGLDSGSVHMFDIEDIEFLATWEFKPESSRMIIVDNQAIIALDIMDRPNKQFLIVATTQKVSVIELRVPKK